MLCIFEARILTYPFPHIAHKSPSHRITPEALTNSDRQVSVQQQFFGTMMPPQPIFISATLPVESDAQGNARRHYQELVERTNAFSYNHKTVLPNEFDPSPLPPGHGNNVRVEPVYENQCTIVPFNSKERLPVMHFANDINALKRRRDFLLKELTSLHVQQQKYFNISYNIKQNLNDTSRSSKRAKRVHNQSPQQPSITQVCKDSIPSVDAKQRSIPMAMKCDGEYLSEYQCLIREQIEIFEASEEDIQSRDRGRNTAIYAGQVGIRCKHCASIPVASRSRGASYFTSTLNGLYQAAQKMTTNHFSNNCLLIPQSVKESLLELKSDRRRAPGGKGYWADGARILGVRETENGGLRLETAQQAIIEDSPTKTK